MAQPSTAPTQMCMPSTAERTVQILWNSAIILLYKVPQEPCVWFPPKGRKKSVFCKHLFKAHCKNQRCTVQSGWSHGELYLLSLLFYCPGPPIDAGQNHKKGRNCAVSSMPKRLRQLSFLRFVFDALARLQQMHKDLWLSLK